MRAATFFVERPVVLDLGLIDADTDVHGEIMPRCRPQLAGRGIRMIAAENVPDGADGLPRSAVRRTCHRRGGHPGPARPHEVPLPSLLIEEPVRSGTQIVFPEGDVTVIGSIASGAEVMAGGTIHVYGAIRGRAVAGFAGNPGARIICRALDAELLAIDGFYLTADDMDATLRGKPAVARLDGEGDRHQPDTLRERALTEREREPA